MGPPRYNIQPRAGLGNSDMVGAAAPRCDRDWLTSFPPPAVEVARDRCLPYMSQRSVVHATKAGTTAQFTRGHDGWAMGGKLQSKRSVAFAGSLRTRLGGWLRISTVAKATSACFWSP